jgi:uncharacterized protein YuzE
MIPLRVSYDDPSDTLNVSFAPGRSATGIELNEHILLRVDKTAREPMGLTIFNFSVLAQLTEMGPRSFPLGGLAEVSAELRDLALEILRRAPVAEYLKLSAYMPGDNPGDSVPIVSLESASLTARAA